MSYRDHKAASNRVCQVAILLLGLLFATRNATHSAEPSSAQDEADIRQAAADYLDALRRGDFEAMRAHWTENGNIVDEAGRKTNVRDLQRPATASTGTSIAPPVLNVRTDSVRFVTPDVAIEDGSSQSALRPNGTTTNGRYSVVWVKRDGKWLIDSVREAAIADQPPANRLQSLAWVIGNWVEQGDTAAFQASFEWSPGDHFIVGQIRIEPRDQEAHVVSQRIGWDAATGTIRSWNFDSHGGYSTGVWARDGEAWVISTSGVLPDGKRTLGRRVFHRIDDESLLMESLGFQVDGESVPDLRVKLNRKSAAEESR